MVGSVVRFVRLPWLLLLIWTIGRFSLGLAGVPYAPRGNAMFSIFSLTLISCLYFGALSGKVGGFTWKGTLLVGVAIGLFGQILIFLSTLISYLGNLNTYFIHWDALNIPEGTTMPMGDAMSARALGLLIAGVIIPAIEVSIGRALAGLAPSSASRNQLPPPEGVV